MSPKTWTSDGWYWQLPSTEWVLKFTEYRVGSRMKWCCQLLMVMERGGQQGVVSQRHFPDWWLTATSRRTARILVWILSNNSENKMWEMTYRLRPYVMTVTQGSRVHGNKEQAPLLTTLAPTFSVQLNCDSHAMTFLTLQQLSPLYRSCIPGMTPQPMS